MSMTPEQRLIAAQEEYINFLGKDISDNASYLAAHNIFASEATVKKGEAIRFAIREAKQEIKDAYNKILNV